MMRISIVSIGALYLFLTCPSEGAKLSGSDPSLETKAILETRGGSLEGCGISSMSKCYGILPPDGSTPSNLIEEIGQVSDAQKCQILCKNLYHGTCNWFMFDRTTNDCMLFSGSLKDLQDDCREVGYAREPNHASCDVVFPSNSSDGCYNFREDYCRFDFSLLENLDDIDSLSECQLACEYVSNCSYFLFDNPTKTCKLYTNESSKRVCDIIHGTPEPDFNTCILDGFIPWESQETVTAEQSTAINLPTEKASSTLQVPELQNPEKDCWSHCNSRQGPCSWCGTKGMCCTVKPGWTDNSNGCDGSFGGATMHECALKPEYTMTTLASVTTTLAMNSSTRRKSETTAFTTTPATTITPTTSTSTTTTSTTTNATVCNGATHQEMGGSGARDVEVTRYSGTTEKEKDISCCTKCSLNSRCEYWVRATDSTNCWLKSNNGREIKEYSSSNRRGGLRATGYECYHYTNSDREKNLPERQMCESAGVGFVFSIGDETQAPGCGNCFCCRPLGIY